MRRLISLSLLVATISYAEPSVYGNTGSYSSRGSISKKNRNEIANLKQQISQLREELEGMKSVVEGQGATINRYRQQSANSGSGTSSATIDELMRKVDKINRNYVSKYELKKSLKSGKVYTATKTKTQKPKPKVQSSSTQSSNADKAVAIEDTPTKLSNSKRYSKAVREVEKKQYSDAKKNFLILKKEGYKKASTYYYLGEVSYRTKKYTDAVEYYKVSASANENASYMDTLLLHTALSLKKQGDISQAKRFFQAIIDSYPKSNSAKVAKKHL